MNMIEFIRLMDPRRPLLYREKEVIKKNLLFFTQIVLSSVISNLVRIFFLNT